MTRWLAFYRFRSDMFVHSPTSSASYAEVQTVLICSMVFFILTSLIFTRYRTDYFRVLRDTDADIERALMEQPLCVSIPNVKGVEEYKGGILDLSLALKNSEEKNESEAHSVLLVGKYTVDVVGFSDISLDIWKVKNQWGSEWGDDGFGHILVDASSITLKTIMENEEEHEMENEEEHERWCLALVSPLVRKLGDPEIIHLDRVEEWDPVLLRDALENQLTTKFIVLLYNDDALRSRPDVLEDLRLLSAVYEHDHEVSLIRIDVSLHPVGYGNLPLPLLKNPRKPRPEVFSFPIKQPRSIDDYNRFWSNKEITFTNLLLWLDQSEFGHFFKQSYRTDYFRVLRDTDADIERALKEQPLCVSIPNVKGVEEYKGIWTRTTEEKSRNFGLLQCNNGANTG